MDALPAQGSPEEWLLAEEGETRIQERIRALPEPYHKVSILYFFEEKPVEEIAKLLNRPKKPYKHSSIAPNKFCANSWERSLTDESLF